MTPEQAKVAAEASALYTAESDAELEACLDRLLADPEHLDGTLSFLCAVIDRDVRSRPDEAIKVPFATRPAVELAAAYLNRDPARFDAILTQLAASRDALRVVVAELMNRIAEILAFAGITSGLDLPGR